jgi:hypothetical protein
MVGAKCWDQIAEGYLISNTGEKCEGESVRGGGQQIRRPQEHDKRDNKCTYLSSQGNP